MWSKISTLQRGLIVLAVPLVSLFPAIITWQWSQQAKQDANWWVAHTKEVISENRLLLGVLVDAETGIRGYTITQNADFLEPYQDAQKTIPITLNKLIELTSDNPQQQENLKQIEQQIQTRLDLLAQVLQIKEAPTPANNTTQKTKLFAEGKAAMDLIRQSLDLFRQEEWNLLDIRQQRLYRINKLTNLAFGVSIFSILLGYGLAVKLYLQSEKQLEQKASKLADSNQDLQAINQLLAERNQELDQFTYIVSHDLKAPLRGIFNLSTWIEEDLTGKIDQDTVKNLALLRSRVARMDNFIDGLLKYARVGRHKEAKTTVDVQQLLHEIIDSLVPPPKFKIDIKDKMPVLQTEALLLQQVFSNLISNAIKHHHRDDGMIEILAQEKGSYYQFAIVDNGVGIAPKYQEKIFAIFQTLTAKDNKESTGIGLSIVKKIINNQGGKIWLDSELGRGTTFYFTWSI
ncbi:MAG: CHASE3 domain-containing protein [Cyanobacteria bacterium P01_A01_bin.83]